MLPVSCAACVEVLAALVADLELLRDRVMLPAPRDSMFDGEEVGRALERGTAIGCRERVHVEGEIAALERAIGLLRIAPSLRSSSLTEEQAREVCELNGGEFFGDVGRRVP